MYCPKCGQSQVSAEVRFCSRCGFSLVGVAKLLASGGVLPERASGHEVSSVKLMSPRRRGVKQGIALLLVGILLLPFFGILHEVTGFPGEFMAFSLIVVMAALIRIIYAAFFEDTAPRRPQFASPPPLHAPPVESLLRVPAQESLPPAQSMPVNDYRQPQVHTAEIMHPPSVTDHTTRLLDKQSDTPER